MPRRLIVVCASAGLALAVFPAVPANAEANCVGQGARELAGPGFGQMVSGFAQQGLVGDFVSGLARTDRTDCPTAP